MRRCVSLLGAFSLLAVLGVSSSAQASSTYPAVVERVAAAKVTCATCHATLDGGADLTLFGASLKARGAVGKSDASLEAALAKMKTDSVDSDGDGARDLDELAWGGDPNVADLPPEVPEEPRYGFCAASARHPTNGPARPTAVHGLALLVALGAVRRARGRRG